MRQWPVRGVGGQLRLLTCGFSLLVIVRGRDVDCGGPAGPGDGRPLAGHLLCQFCCAARRTRWDRPRAKIAAAVACRATVPTEAARAAAHSWHSSWPAKMPLKAFRL